MRKPPALPRAIRLLAAAALVLGLRAANPADYRQKLGVYVWDKLAAGLPAAAADLHKLGPVGAVRVAIGPSWDPSGRTDNSPLDVKARRTDYRAFLAAFPVVMLTAYDSASFKKYKNGRLDAAHLAATRDEFRRFTLELARTPGRKIVSNWEFKKRLPGRPVISCEEYYQARLDGILEGRKQARRSVRRARL